MRPSADGKLGLGRHIFRHAVGPRGHNHDLLPGETAAKLDIGRVEIEPGSRGLGREGENQKDSAALKCTNPKSQIRNPKQIQNPNEK